MKQRPLLMFLSDDTICMAGKLALYQWERTENNSMKREAGRTCLSVSLSHPNAPVRSLSLSEDLLLVGEFKAERCIRGCHIKCECFPLSNLITDFMEASAGTLRDRVKGL